MTRRSAAAVALGIAALMVVVLAIADVTSSARITRGSVGIPARTSTLERLPDDATCTAPSGCADRFAFAADETVTAWVTVRNDSPVAVTLDGVPHSWLSQFQPRMLIRPVEVLDGGDPSKESRWSTAPAPFRPVVLLSGEEHAIGVVFHTVADVPYACEYWAAGTGVAFEGVPVAWHWLVAEHEMRVTFMRPLEIRSPTPEDCSAAGAGR